MSDAHPSAREPDRDDPRDVPGEIIADANVERLLREAYRPELPSARFVHDVERRLLEMAGERADRRRPPARSAGTAWSIPGIVWRCAAIAAVISLGIGVPIWVHALHDADAPQVRWDGQTVWIDGRPYRSTDAAPAATRRGASGSNAPLIPALFEGSDPAGGLSPRPRPQAPTIQQASAGQSIRTRAGERRRVGMIDGSSMMLNENTQVSIDGPRKVTVSSGEVFVDAFAQQGGAADEAQPDDPTFTVTTPSRLIRGRGTKFQVDVSSDGTGVFVTQGKVLVSGAGLPEARSVGAGQRLAPEHATEQPADTDGAPRAAAVLGWTRDLVAASETPLVPASQYAGGALVALDPSGQAARLELRNYHVDVYIEDGFARTTIDQTYFNRQSARVEGTFYFPLPADAQLSRLAMYVDGRLMEGGMAERDYARTVYENIVRKMQDPALLEWVDGTTFKMRVFPLEGRQEKRIILSYTQRLPSAYGRSDYRFPAARSLGPISAWSFHARVKGGASLAWQSAAPGMQAKIEGSDLLLDSQARNVVLDRDVALRFGDTSAGDRASGNLRSPIENPKSAEARFCTVAQDGYRYLMLRYRPALPAEPVRERRDWVFLYESSADRNPLLARTQVEIVRAILANAEPEDTFSIITAGTRTELLTPAPLPATPENASAALDVLGKTHLVGALDLGNALATAEPLLTSAKNPYLVHLGSGIAAMGERREAALFAHLPPSARYVGIGVGRRWSRAFMKNAATHTGGYYTQVNPDEPIAWRGFDIVSTLNAPRLLDLHADVQTQGAQPRGAQPKNPSKGTFLFFDDAVAQGEQLCAILRVPSSDPLPAAIQISGRLNGQPWSQTAPVKNVADGATYLPRAWARLEIDRLLAENADANRAKIVELSKSMYVMSPFTSLLVLENEQMYEQFHVDRGRKDHWALYPCPARIEVKAEPIAVVPPAPMMSPAARPVTSPDVEEVLKTFASVPRPALILRPNDSAAPPEEAAGYTLIVPGTDAAYGRADDIFLSPDPEIMSVPRLTSSRMTVPVPDRGVLWLGGQWISNPATFTMSPETSVPGTIGRTAPPLNPWEEYKRRSEQRLNGLTDRTSIQIRTLTDAQASLRTPTADADPRRSQAEEIQRQANAYKTRLLVDDGRKAEQEGRPAAARDAYAQSLQLDPSNQVAADGHNRMLSSLGQNTHSTTALTRAEQRIQIEQQQIRYDFDQSLADANAAVASLDFATAHAAFSRARTAATINPGIFDPQQIRRFNDGLADLYRRIQLAEDSFAADAERFRETRTLERIRRRQEDVRRLSEGTVTDLIATARRLTDDGRYREALGVVDQILVLEPRNDYAIGVRTLLEDTASFADQRRFRDGWPMPGSAQRQSAEEGKVPYDDIQRYPFGWPDLSTMRDDVVTRSSVPPAPAGDAVQAALDRKISDLTFNAASLSDVIEVLRNLGGAPIVVDWKLLASAGVERSAPVTARLRSVTLAQALTTVLQNVAPAARIGYTISDGTIHIAPESARLLGGALLYRPAQVSTDPRVFSDLLACAPGMQNGEADVLAVLEAEARPHFAEPRAGKVDPGARRLIDRARALGWRQITVPPTRTRASFVVTFDGAGRYQWERSVGLGLREQVVCDDVTLRHLYPEIGVGAERTVSRFHRAALRALVPWALPPVEELSRDAEITVVGERTIAITPIGAAAPAGAGKRENHPATAPSSRPTSQPADYVCTHLAFAEDGRLAERAWIEMPSGNVLFRETYDADGTVKSFDADGALVRNEMLKLRPAAAPDLAPKVADLVILPLPLRKSAGAGPVPTLVPNAGATHPYDRLSDADARDLLAAQLANGGDLQLLIARHFLHHGDRRLGLYTLLMSAGVTWDPSLPYDAGGVRVAMDPVKDQPRSPLAHYIVQQLQVNREGSKCDAGQFPKLYPLGAGFLPRLAVFRGCVNRWTSGNAARGTDAQRKEEVREAVLFAHACPDPYVAWAVTAVLREHDTSADAEEYASMAHLLKPLLDLPGLQYESRYEYATLLAKAGEGGLARETFAQLYRQTLDRGILPPIDSAFRAAFCEDAPADAAADWTALMRESAAKLIGRGDRISVILLARQCRLAGAEAVGDALLDRAVHDTMGGSASAGAREGGSEGKVDFNTILAAVQYLADFKQPARAEALLAPLLTDAKYARYSELWRLASALAEQRGAIGRSLNARERAMAIELDQSGDVVNLASIRQDYGKLLADYAQLASAVVALEAPPPKDLLAGIIRAADRWRSVDTDAAPACQAAARALEKLGAKDLAWEYLTSPLADHPNESAAWQALAQSLRTQGDAALADRAYRTAFEMEPTNAQLLWDRAQLLQEAGRSDEARGLYRAIADGQWESKFAALREQARGILR